MKKIFVLNLAFVTLLLTIPLSGAANQLNGLSPVSLEQICVKGELQKRLGRNFNRLEKTKYKPENVFLTMKQSGDWPGDTEGRTILGLVLDAQATAREQL